MDNPAPAARAPHIILLSLAAATGLFALRDVYAARHVKYFRDLRLDGRYEFVGEEPIAPAAAKSARCFRFIYDMAGRPKRIEALANGRPAYDVTLGAARVSFAYYEDQEVRTLQNTRADPARGGWAREASISFDDTGKIGSLTNEDGRGGPAMDDFGVARRLWLLDSEGRIVRESYFDLEDRRIADKAGRYELRYAYDEAGDLVERANYGRDGVLRDDLAGVARIRWNRDAQTGRLEARAFNARGRPTRLWLYWPPA
jgi:hypothetical protein